MVAYCQRFNPFIVRMKELLDRKTYGETFQVSMWTEQFTDYGSASWASSAATLGGGQLFSHGCHYIDLLLWMLGRPVSGCHLGTNLGTPWMEMEGTSQVSIKFENGALGYHGGTWGARGTRLRYSFHAHCTEGMIEVAKTADSHYQMYLHTRGEEDAKGKAELLMEGTTSKSAAEETLHFLDCIETGREPLTNARESLQGLRVIWRLYEAERRGVVADLRGLGLDQA